MKIRSHLAPAFLLAAMSLTAPACILDLDDDYYGPPPPPAPSAEFYEMCYADADCLGGAYCTELAVPAVDFGEYVSAVCSAGCFDDLDCPVSVFNQLPGACIPHDVVGGFSADGVCIERCEFDSDCDVAGGFACEFWFGERLCLPIQ